MLEWVGFLIRSVLGSIDLPFRGLAQDSNLGLEQRGVFNCLQEASKLDLGIDIQCVVVSGCIDDLSTPLLVSDPIFGKFSL